MISMSSLLLLSFLVLTVYENASAFLPIPLTHRSPAVPVTFRSSSRTRYRNGISPLRALTVPNLSGATEESSTDQQGKEDLRPFHQQWWPVAAISSLKKDRPNPLQLLGMSLVAYHDGKNWKVLDDRCSHRFAPLSEGRVIVSNNSDDAEVECSNHLQCAYHGWEFNAEGRCTLVPQEPKGGAAKARPIQTYPTREDVSILWVWSDPESFDSLGDSIPLPVNPLLRKTAQEWGPNFCFQRDLPYGMEILGENLLDLSHLPFSHHSVGGMTRSMGGAMPTRMLSKEERLENAKWEEEFIHQHSDAQNNHHPRPALPLFQAEIESAAEHDPLYIGFAKQVKDPNITKSWTTTIGYYEPCHVRYKRRRSDTEGSHVELFFCPTTEGRSRVFLFNVFQRKPASKPPSSTASWSQKLAYWTKPSTWKEKAFAAVLKKLLSGEQGHMISHTIFDGDGIFLHKQGNRMKRSDLTFRDYSTPASADILLNAYRRFLDQVAQRTRLVVGGPYGDALAQSVVGTNGYSDDTTARSILLDRYNTHTKNCPVCLAALQKARRQKSRLQVLQNVLQGSMGASSVAVLVLLSWIRQSTTPVAPSTSVVRVVVLTAMASFAGSLAAKKLQRNLETKIQSFLFEDYVHAEKN